MIASELEKLQRELKVQEGIHKKTDEDLAKLKVAEKLN